MEKSSYDVVCAAKSSISTCFRCAKKLCLIGRTILPIAQSIEATIVDWDGYIYIHIYIHTYIQTHCEIAHRDYLPRLTARVSSYIAEYYDRMLWYMPHVYFMLNPPSVDWCVLVASCCSSKLPRTGILPNSLHCIGQTPMVRLDKIAKKEGLQCELREFTIISIACVSSLYMCTS